MDQATVKRWWLALNGQTDGPRTQAFIAAGLQSGNLNRTTLCCLEGEAEWKPLTAWAEFATVANATSAPPPPTFGSASLPPPPDFGQGKLNHPGYDNLLTNPRLPKMANWICIFTILLLPLYWVFDALESLVTMSSLPPQFDSNIALFVFTFLIGGPLTLAITAFLVAGGLRLRDLRASGLRIIRIGIWCDLGFMAIELLVGLILILAMDTQEVTMNGGVLLIEFVTMLLGLSAFAFEVLALVWLTKHASDLPLDASR